jgi:hypothetical protein
MIDAWKSEGYRLLEWDIARGRSVRSRDFEYAPGGPPAIQTGSESRLVQTGRGFAYLAGGYEDTSPLELAFIDDELRRYAHVIVASEEKGRRPHLAADDETVVVSSCDDGRLHLRSYAVATGKPIGDRHSRGWEAFMCHGLRMPIGFTTLHAGSVWVVDATQRERAPYFELLRLERTLSRIEARWPVPFPIDPLVREGKFSPGTPVAIGAGKVVLKSEDALWTRALEGHGWQRHRVEGPQSQIALDPSSGAIATADGIWREPNGAILRRFKPPALTPGSKPGFPNGSVTWVGGRALTLAAKDDGDYLVITQRRQANDSTSD